jgi:hypothetical protein
MIRFLLGAAAASVILSAPASAAASDPSIAAMALEDGVLTGPGAALLTGDLERAQFILVGEDHGFADPPEIALALAKASRKYGVVNHVVEEGPLIEEWAEANLKAGGVDALGAALAGKPLALAFLSRREDAVLAEYFVKNAPRERDALWGVDQEFIGSSVVHLETLATLARNDVARKFVGDALEAEKQAVAAGNLGALFLSTATPATFAELRAAFAGARPALAIIDGLEASAAIYGSYNAGKNFASNTDRIDLMRRQFLSAYGEAKGAAPRALFKFGAIHVAKGTTFLNTFDLGSLTEGMAAANGLEALRVLIMPLAGTQLQISPSPEGLTKTADFRSKYAAALLKAIGVDEASIPEDGYAVIALEPIRRRLEADGLGALGAQERFFLLGYDYLVTTRGARAATPLAN